MRKVCTVEICTASFPVVFVWIAVMDSLHIIVLADMLQAGIRTSIHLQW